MVMMLGPIVGTVKIPADKPRVCIRGAAELFAQTAQRGELRGPVAISGNVTPSRTV